MTPVKAYGCKKLNVRNVIHTLYVFLFVYLSCRICKYCADSLYSFLSQLCYVLFDELNVVFNAV